MDRIGNLVPFAPVIAEGGAAASAVTVAVRPGETLAQLARRLDSTPAELLAANPALAALPPGQALPAGLRVRVPGAAGEAPAASERQLGRPDRHRARGAREDLAAPAAPDQRPGGGAAEHARRAEATGPLVAGLATAREAPASAPSAPELRSTGAGGGPRTAVILPWVAPSEAPAGTRSQGTALALPVMAGSALMAVALGLKGGSALELVLGLILGGLLGGLGSAISASCDRPPAAKDRRARSRPGPGGAR